MSFFTDQQSLITFIASISGVIVGIFLSFLYKRFFPFFGKKENYHDVVVMGVGGSGKTSLIMQLAGEKGHEPSVTTGLNIWNINFKNNGDPIRIMDTRGQAPGEAISEINKSDDGEVIFVIVVDLVGAYFEKRDIRSNEVEKERVHMHVEYWNASFLSSVSAVLPKNTPVIIFINKIDILKGDHERNVKKATHYYSELIDNVHRYFDDVKVIAGSAKYGTGLNILREELIEMSDSERHTR